MNDSLYKDRFRFLICWALYFLLAATIIGVLWAKPTDGLGIAALGAVSGPFAWLVKTYFVVKSDESLAAIKAGSQEKVAAIQTQSRENVENIRQTEGD